MTRAQLIAVASACVALAAAAQIERRRRRAATIAELVAAMRQACAVAASRIGK